MSATGPTSAFNGFQWVPIENPFRCHWGIFGGWNISGRESPGAPRGGGQSNFALEYVCVLLLLLLLLLLQSLNCT